VFSTATVQRFPGAKQVLPSAAGAGGPGGGGGGGGAYPHAPPASDMYPVAPIPQPPFPPAKLASLVVINIGLQILTGGIEVNSELILQSRGNDPRAERTPARFIFTQLWDCMGTNIGLLIVIIAKRKISALICPNLIT